MGKILILQKFNVLVDHMLKSILFSIDDRIELLTGQVPKVLPLWAQKTVFCNNPPPHLTVRSVTFLKIGDDLPPSTTMPNPDTKIFDPNWTLEDARGKLIFCTLPASRTGVVNFIEQELKEQF